MQESYRQTLCDISCITTGESKFFYCDFFPHFSYRVPNHFLQIDPRKVEVFPRQTHRIVYLDGKKNSSLAAVTTKPFLHAGITVTRRQQNHQVDQKLILPPETHQHVLPQHHTHPMFTIKLVPCSPLTSWGSSSAASSFCKLATFCFIRSFPNRVTTRCARSICVSTW